MADQGAGFANCCYSFGDLIRYCELLISMFLGEVGKDTTPAFQSVVCGGSAQIQKQIRDRNAKVPPRATMDKLAEGKIPRFDDQDSFIENRQSVCEGEWLEIIG
jgi:hypothetical protein